MSTSMIPALLLPGIRKAAGLAGAKWSLQTNFETGALRLGVRKGELFGTHHLFSSAELEDGSYKELFDRRLREIFGPYKGDEK